ncbi:MAG: hypothetical protein ACE5H3_00460 [Planctomycetota bacterium]
MRSRPLLLGALCGLLALLPACLTGGRHRTHHGSAAMAQASHGGNQGITLHVLPKVRYPEEFLVQVDRLVEMRSREGVLQGYQEQFLSDGQGNFRLDLKGFRPGQGQGLVAPSPLQADTWERRQRFLVHYRDLHLGPQRAALGNYEFTSLPGTFPVAGRDGDKFEAVSRHGLGRVEFVVDRQTRLLLQWAFYSPGGELLGRLTTQTLQKNPDLNGVLWSTRAVDEAPYRGEIDNPILGFAPLKVRYAPDGFALKRQRLLLSAPTTGNLLLEVFSDGLRTLFVAQQKGDPALIGEAYRSGLNGGKPARSLFARESLVGAVRVFEGDVFGRSVFVVGPVGRDELMTVFGSLSQN